jgi:hypothetical protein
MLALIFGLLAFGISLVHRKERNKLRNEAKRWKMAFDELYAKSKYAHLVPDPLSAKSVIQRQQKARKKALTLKQEINRLTKPTKYRGNA